MHGELSVASLARLHTPPNRARAFSTSRPPLHRGRPRDAGLKRNAAILGAWIAAIRIAPYVCHAVQGALSK